MRRNTVIQKTKLKGKDKRQFRATRIICGEIQGNARGFAFLLWDGPDLFIPASGLRGAIHGDTVEVETDGNEGRVVRIIQQGPDIITGTYVKSMREEKVIPSDRHYGFDVSVIGGRALNGDCVAVKLSRKDRTKGEIVKNFGASGTLDSTVAALVARLGTEDFKAKALKDAAASAALPITAEGRRDFREQPCFTIDGRGSKDFDDGVYAEETSDGYRLFVHIADVTHYVKLYGHADREAFNRGNSFYYGEKVIPMLPESLSNGACSLVENEDRLTLTVIMNIKNGVVEYGEVCEGIIRSRKRMTYEDVSELLDGKNVSGYEQFAPSLALLKRLRDDLKRRRDEGGNIDFNVPEPKFTFDNGRVSFVERAPKLIAHSIIEECMIAANSFIAKMFAQKPIVFREHRNPSPEKINELNGYLAAMGVKKLDQPSSADVANMLGSVPPEKATAVSMMTLRSMSKACYSAESEGHFGLGLRDYCHFTSPIRRYSDLYVHRIVKAVLHGDELKDVAETVAMQCNEREKISLEVERDINDAYIADYMCGFVGQTFEGIISGVTEWGFYVQLDNTAEGLVRIESLHGRAVFNAKAMTITTGQRVFALGDKIKVLLVAVGERGIDFEYVY